MKIAVLGGGSWGTAISVLLSQKNVPVTLWVKRSERAKELSKKRINAQYLPGIQLPPSITVTADLPLVGDSSVLIGAVPSLGMHDLLDQLSQLNLSRELVEWVNLTKGIEYDAKQKSLKTMSELVRMRLGVEKIYSLSGPSFAQEVASGSPTTVVLAGKHIERTERMQKLFTTDRFRVYTSNDLVGVELGGVFKNIIALAAGISDGLGFGENAKGALISRGLIEMTRLGMTMGAKKETFFGLAGLGDMVISAMSDQSRNHQVGRLIGEGNPLDQILDSMKMIAEGVYTTQAIHQYAVAENLDLPITAGVYDVLYEGADPLDKLSELMSREPKREEI